MSKSFQLWHPRSLSCSGSGDPTVWLGLLVFGCLDQLQGRVCLRLRESPSPVGQGKERKVGAVLGTV